MSYEQQVKKRMLQVVAFFVVAILIVVRESIVGVLSPRGMAITMVLIMGVGWIFLTVSFKRVKRQPTQDPVGEKAISDEQKKLKKSVIAFQIWLAIMVFALVNGLWSTRGESLLPRSIGAAVNLLVSSAILTTIRRQKARIASLSLLPTTTPSLTSTERSQTL